MLSFREKKYEAYRQLLLVWLILNLFSHLERIGSLKRYEHMFSVKTDLIIIPVMGMCIAAIVVVHYYWLYDRYAVHKKYGRYLMLLASYLCLVVAVDFFTMLLLERAIRPEIDYEPFNRLQTSVMRVFIADIPIAFVYAVVRDLYKKKQAADRLEADNHKNELLLLRSKLEPKLITNALQALYTTAEREQAPKTAAYIHELAQLFRYSTEHAGIEKIPMAEELNFITKYILLQKSRIAEDENTIVESRIINNEITLGIAPMVLLPFIENAFKYGVSYEQQSRIDISIDVSNNHLSMQVENTNHAGRGKQASTRMGLDSAIKRLRLQYRDKYQLEQRNENGVYFVSLKIDLN